MKKIKHAKKQMELEAREAGLRQIKDTAMKSVADPEAMSFPPGKQGFRFGYNAQAVVDSENQMQLRVHKRGFDAVLSWWRLCCLVHNIEKIVDAMAKKLRIEPAAAT